MHCGVKGKPKQRKTMKFESCMLLGTFPIGCYTVYISHAQNWVLRVLSGSTLYVLYILRGFGFTVKNKMIFERNIWAIKIISRQRLAEKNQCISPETWKCTHNVIYKVYNCMLSIFYFYENETTTHTLIKKFPLTHFRFLVVAAAPPD